MDHEKQFYRKDENGVVRYSESGEGTIANLQQRTAVGKHKDGSVYLRAADAEDLAKVKDAADAVGVNYRQRRGGASHFGRLGSYEHLHFDHPADAASVHAVLGYHLEEDGKPKDHDDHLAKLAGGLQHHVQGKDSRVDACMLNTRHAHQMSLDAGKADTPEVHRSAAQFHRLSAEAHRAQAARPWTKGEGSHHAGMAVVHNAIATQHDAKAVAAQKRIQAELKRQAEMKAKMEAAEEGRETKKALDEAVAEHTEECSEQEPMREVRKDLGTAGAGTELSTLDGGGALRAENHDDELADATVGREVQKADPTESQIKAGNYAMEHHKVHGLDISIENPVGSTRRGVAKDGTAWETTMSHHYGYIKRTEGADGDHVDCFLGPDTENPYVHVINQVEPTTGKFDEHKVMIGFKSREDAIDAYHANYQKGWKGCDEVKSLHVDDFKSWLKNGDTKSRLIYKAACTRLHTVARIQMQTLRSHPGIRLSPVFTDAVHAAKTAGVTDAEILRTVTNATGAFAPLVKHFKDNS